MEGVLDTPVSETEESESVIVLDTQSKPILLPSSPYTTDRINTKYIQIPSSPPVVRTSEVQIVRRKSDESAYSEQDMSAEEVLSELESEGDSARSFETEEEYEEDETMRPRIYDGVSDEVSSMDEPDFDIYASSDAETMEEAGVPERKDVDVMRQYTPRSNRLPFRTPSSVRNVQLETTPPHLRTPTSHRLSKGSLPRSIRSSRSRLFDGSPRRMSPAKRERSNIVKEHPLVLLHMTLLPLRTLSQTTQSHLSTTSRGQETLTRYHRLQARFSSLDTVLSRGILIAHPREDYDLLIERVLESLELEDGRVRPCGHFISPDAPDANVRSSCLHESFSEIEGLDAPRCDDCFAPIISRIDHAANAEQRRWDVRVFASNGLMSPGAWSAAWREMERVDVEVGVWCEEFDLLEGDGEGEKEELVECEIIEENGVQAEDPSEKHMEETRGEERMETERDRKKRMSEERRREIYGDVEEKSAPAKIDTKEDIPLSKLLVAALRVFLLDSRNVALMLLSVLVLGLAWSLAVKQDGSMNNIRDMERLAGEAQTLVQIPEMVISASPESIQTHSEAVVSSVPSSLIEEVVASVSVVVAEKEQTYTETETKTAEEVEAKTASVGVLEIVL